MHPELPSERIVKNIRRATRKRHSSEEKIRIVLDGLRGESSIAELCRREGIAEGLYYAWSKEFLEAGKRRLAGDGKARRPPFRPRLNEPNRQLSVTSTRRAGCLARCVAGACFGAEGDRKRTGGHGQGCCTLR